MALSKLHLCGLVWVAWTDFGSVGEGRRAVLGKSDKSSQGSGHPGLDPVKKSRYPIIGCNSIYHSENLAAPA